MSAPRPPKSRFPIRAQSRLRPLAISLLLLLASCATPNTGRLAEPSRSADTLLAEARRAKDPSKGIGLALAAAHEASRKLSTEEGRLIYNAACVEIAARVGTADNVALPQTYSTPAGAYRLEFNSRQPGAWGRSEFTELLPRSEMKNKVYVTKDPLPGYGGAVVGVNLPPNPRALFLPRIGASAAVTAVVQFAKPDRPGNPAVATLTLFDPVKESKVRIAGSTRSLAADFTAPFGIYPTPSALGLLGALRPGRYVDKEGLFLVQPYDPTKIPLVFVHGLISVPQMWLPVMAALESDPVIRKNYQFWVFAYPTGNPIAFSALQLRESLQAAYKVYPRSRDMVIINHSLGGDLTHLQVIDPGDALVKGIFKKSAPEIMAMPADSVVKRALIYKANRRIDRVIFIAAPHLGAPMAINPLAKFAGSLIRLPATLLSSIGTETLELAAAAAGLKGPVDPTVQEGLSPYSPLLVAMNTVPIIPPFHSIIGVAGKPLAPLEQTSDTVVPYWSSHLAAARSEKIVPAPHTTIFEHPESIVEMKRILRLHLGVAAE